MIKLDAYDKKILEILLKNSKEPVTSIAKSIRLGRENVDYKINRLIKEGVIKEPITIFNENNLGLTRYVLFVELINLGKDTENKILEYLKNNKYISWIGINGGKRGLIFDVIIKERTDLDRVLSDFLNKFNKYIGDYIVLNSKEVVYFPEKMLELNANKLTSKKTERINIDKIDNKILSILDDDAWINYVKLSEKVGLTPNGINNRIKNLEKKEIISGYSISLDWKKLGWELYGIQLKTTKFGKEVNDKLISYFKNNKRVIFYYKYIGGIWDYDIGVIVKDSEELREYLNEFRTVFSDVVKITDVSIILREVTGYKLPKGIFE